MTKEHELAELQDHLEWAEDEILEHELDLGARRLQLSDCGPRSRINSVDIQIVCAATSRLKETVYYQGLLVRVIKDRIEALEQKDKKESPNA